MTKNNYKRGVLLFSGGIDSTLSAIVLLAQNIELISLSVDYPGRPMGEKRAIKALEKELAFSKSITMSIDTGSSLRKFEHKNGSDQGWIPYRNLLFWALAVHQAVMIDADFVAAGHDDDDAVAYSDASTEFFTKLEQILEFTGSEKFNRPVKVELPVYTAELAYLEKLARDNYQIMSLTWSCWLNESVPCMECYACKERKTFLEGISN
jgi:7-cyano-7-deazaguanine synthase